MKRLIYNSDEDVDNKRPRFMDLGIEDSESEYTDTVDSDFDLDLNSMYFCSKCLCEYKNTQGCNCRCHIKSELKNDDLRDILNEIQRKKKIEQQTFQHKTLLGRIYEDENEDEDNLMETEQEPHLDENGIYSGSSCDIYSEDADNEDTDTDTDTDED